MGSRLPKALFVIGYHRAWTGGATLVPIPAGAVVAALDTRTAELFSEQRHAVQLLVADSATIVPGWEQVWAELEGLIDLPPELSRWRSFVLSELQERWLLLSSFRQVVSDLQPSEVILMPGDMVPLFGEVAELYAAYLAAVGCPWRMPSVT